MNRRNILATIGTIVGTGGFAVGSGAFTTVSAKRAVSVSVADDDSAFLALTQRASGERSKTDGVPETIELSIPGDDEGDYPKGNPTNPKGLGTDSVYQFGGDAAGDEPGLFAVENRGTQPVELYSTQPTTVGLPEVTMYNIKTGNLLTEKSPSSPITVGEKVLCGLSIDTHNVDARQEEYDLSLTINADAVGPS